MDAKNQPTVFISHGHDREVITTVAKFVETLGLKVTVLDEQPKKGQTIVDKFENMQIKRVSQCPIDSRRCWFSKAQETQAQSTQDVILNSVISRGLVERVCPL